MVPSSSALFSLQYSIALKIVVCVCIYMQMHTQSPLIYIYILYIYIYIYIYWEVNRLYDNRNRAERIQVHLFPTYCTISYIKVSPTCFGPKIWSSSET
jgi:uncharacterized membrane protein (DUF106 family)